jgi:DNA mismatch repair protein MutS
MVKLTPGMDQYMKVKNQNPDCIILFRMGDFYETFFEDAKTVAKELEITLTARGKGDSRAPLAGIPYHALEPYLAKLIKKGYKVGIVEQTEDPKKAKGLVKRDLIRIITPGTVIESLILNQGSNNYILCFYKENNEFSISFCDISTGEFLTAKLNEKEFFNEIKKLSPREIIFPMSLEESEIIKKLKIEEFILTSYDDRFFYNEKANETLLKHFNVLSLKGFGEINEIEQNSSGALLNYLKETQKNSLLHINKIQKYKLEEYMHIDHSSIKNLEILKNLSSGSEESTLLGVLDKTLTPMGKRLIKKWITLPLLNKFEIEKKHSCVEELKEDIILRQEIKEILKNVYDIERLIGKVSFGNANPKDLVSLKLSLQFLPKLKKFVSVSKTKELKEILTLPDLAKLVEIIENSIKEDPNTIIKEGNIIKKCYNLELDELREISTNTKKYLFELEEKEKERTKIKSLKIRYNKVFGYYIEISKSYLNRVPSDYIRKQTQVNCERFITEELKEKEAKILGAEERIFQLEYELFIEVLENLKKFTDQVQESARKIAKLDCLISLAQIADDNNYAKPEFNNESIIEIIDSRHPIIEAFSNTEFIPNSCKLTKEKRTMIITGPNMAGKSTYLRQIALVCLMAQIGSYVPAKKALLPIIDRIFTRIGAYDDLVHSQSTFMVEMTETANILNNATENSLVILDEIGRGTSTFDGVSLAWGIAEYLNNKIKSKTLFATHYHHLNALKEKYEGIENYNISVEETEDKIIFLRKIIPGGTDKSYGIQVAKLAGIPNEVIDIAKETMNLIELEDEIGEKLQNKSIIDNENLYNKNEKDETEVAKKVKELKEAIKKDSDLSKFL